MSDDLSGPTSDVGMLYRDELKRRGSPMDNANLQRLIMESQRTPGLIPGLTVQGEGSSGARGGSSAGSSAGSGPPSPGMPTPPMPPNNMISNAIGEPQAPPPVDLRPPMQAAAPTIPTAPVRPTMFNPADYSGGPGAPAPSPAPASPAAVASTVLNSTQPTSEYDDMRPPPIRDSGPGMIPQLIDRFVRGMGSTPPPTTGYAREAEREFGTAPGAPTPSPAVPAVPASPPTTPMTSADTAWALAPAAGAAGAAGVGTIIQRMLAARPDRWAKGAVTEGKVPAPPPETRGGMPQQSGTTLTPNNIPITPGPAPNPGATSVQAGQNATILAQQQAQAAQEARDAMSRQAAQMAMRGTSASASPEVSTTVEPPTTAELAARNATVRDQKQAADSRSAKDAMSKQAADNALKDNAGKAADGPPSTLGSPKGLDANQQSVYDRSYQQFKKLGHDDADAIRYATEALNKAKLRGVRIGRVGR